MEFLLTTFEQCAQASACQSVAVERLLCVKASVCKSVGVYGSVCKIKACCVHKLPGVVASLCAKASVCKNFCV